MTQEQFAQHVRDLKVGEGPDCWLEIKNAFGEWEKIALIFGYMDDFEACEEFAKLARGEFKSREYRCVPTM